MTQEELKSLLSYCSESGQFLWLKSYRNQHTGKVAGSLDKDGYRVIKINRKPYRAHNLAWLYVYGCLPKNIIDHIDGSKDNNAISNLRDVTYAENSHNQRRAHKDSLTGFIGIDYNKTKKRYRARIQLNGMRVTLGGFDTPEKAHNAYLQAKRQLHRTCEI